MTYRDADGEWHGTVRQHRQQDNRFPINRTCREFVFPLSGIKACEHVAHLIRKNVIQNDIPKKLHEGNLLGVILWAILESHHRVGLQNSFHLFFQEWEKILWNFCCFMDCPWGWPLTHSPAISLAFRLIQFRHWSGVWLCLRVGGSMGVSGGKDIDCSLH